MDTRNIQDHHRRQLFAKHEVERRLFKALLRDPDLPQDLQDKFRGQLKALPRNSALTRIRNRCIFTGRPRGILSLFRMSRIVFRTLANRGDLNGVRKSSW